MSRLIYRWNFAQSKGVVFCGLTFYKTHTSCVQLPCYAFEFGRLSISWTRNA